MVGMFSEKLFYTLPYTCNNESKETKIQKHLLSQKFSFFYSINSQDFSTNNFNPQNEKCNNRKFS